MVENKLQGAHLFTKCVDGRARPSVEVLLEQRDHALRKQRLGTPRIRVADLDRVDEGERLWRERGGVFGGADYALDGVAEVRAAL